MTEHKKMLEAAEEAAKAVQDPELRKIAFQEIVKNELQKNLSGNHPANPAAPATVVTTPKPPRAKPQSTGGRAKGARETVKHLDISPDENGLPAWSAMTQDWKKFCWILEAAKLKGVDGLTAPEITYLIYQIFRENYKSALMANLKKKIRGGFVRTTKIDVDGRKIAVWQILSGGSKAINQPVEVAESK
jgi:hypothetical protein